MQQLIQQSAQKFTRRVPDVRPGYTVKVHQKIQEGNKERVQVFQGLVIAVHKGQSPTDASFTVRRIVEGIGVERVYPLHSPNIEKIEVVKVASVRRAKLYYMRERRGKATRLTERFTTAGEFDVAEEPVAETVEEVVDTGEPEVAEADTSSQGSEEQAEEEKQ